MTGGSKLFPDYLAGGCFLSDTMTSLLTFYHSINVKKKSLVSNLNLENRKKKLYSANKPPAKHPFGW